MCCIIKDHPNDNLVRVQKQKELFFSWLLRKWALMYTEKKQGSYKQEPKIQDFVEKW